jgi:elongation factor P
MSKSKVENVLLLKEGLPCQVSVWNDEVIEVTLPLTVEYTVVDTPPNFKGNTAQGAQKPATLDSGAVVNVPMFIETGEKIIVSTADCKYVNRATGDKSF